MARQRLIHARAPGRRLLTLDWYHTLSGQGRLAFWTTYVALTLEAYDFLTLTFAMSAIATTFDVTTAEASLAATIALGAAAIGGIVVGALADTFGRVRVLMATIALYTLCALLSGVAGSIAMLLLFRALQGVGFGGERAAGPVLIAELASAEQRGRAVGTLQSAWSTGWALAALAFAVTFSLLPPDPAWRVLFWVGVPPSLLVLWLRARLREPAIYLAAKQAGAAGQPALRPLAEILAPRLRGTTAAGSLLATSMMGGMVTAQMWLPTYLQTTRGMAAAGTSALTGDAALGSFVGALAGGYAGDWLGRRRATALFAVGSVLSVLLYVLVPAGVGALLLVPGFLLGFFTLGIMAPVSAYLAELYPTSARAAGQSFCFNVARGVSGLVSAAVGFLSAGVGLAGGLAVAAGLFGLCLTALPFLPETRGKDLGAGDRGQ